MMTFTNWKASRTPIGMSGMGIPSSATPASMSSWNSGEVGKVRWVHAEQGADRQCDQDKQDRDDQGEREIADQPARGGQRPQGKGAGPLRGRSTKKTTTSAAIAGVPIMATAMG